MANATSTNQSTAKNAAKPAAEKKAPVAVHTRIVDQMKRGTLGGKLTAEQLDTIANLAASLKVFVQA